MRWWTLAFAAVMAIGGVLGHAAHGSVESLFVGGAAAAALASCSAAMSDMTDWGHGPLAVKVAWAICALLAIKVGDLRSVGGCGQKAGRCNLGPDPHLRQPWLLGGFGRRIGFSP